jgi:hypothetical protein
LWLLAVLVVDLVPLTQLRHHLAVGVLVDLELVLEYQ